MHRHVDSFSQDDVEKEKVRSSLLVGGNFGYCYAHSALLEASISRFVQYRLYLITFFIPIAAQPDLG